MDESRLTHTTLRHIREFLKQEVDSCSKWTKKEILSLKNGLEVSSSMTLEDFLNGKDIMDFINAINNGDKSFIEKFKLSTKELLLKELRKYYENNLQLLYSREFKIIEDNATYLEESLLILREITHYVKEDYLLDYNYINLCFKLDEILEEISLEDDFSLFDSINFFIENWK